MRTKTLLLTAALAAAGAATSMAQSIYSVNAVGYVNKAVVSGFNLIANPFVVADESIGTLIPDGSSDHSLTAYKLADNGGVTIALYDPSLSPDVWDNPGLTIELGKGVIILNGGAAINLTFVGEVKQGTPVSNPIPGPGLAVRSSKVPQQATATTLGLIPTGSVTMTRYGADGASFIQNLYDPSLGTGPDGWDSEPTIGIAEAFFLQTSNPEPWDRNFTVN